MSSLRGTKKRAADKPGGKAKKPAPADLRNLISVVLEKNLQERLEEIEKDRLDHLKALENVKARREEIEREAEDERAFAREDVFGYEATLKDLIAWNKSDADEFMERLRAMVSTPVASEWRVDWSMPRRVYLRMEVSCPERLDHVCSSYILDRIAAEITPSFPVRASAVVDEDSDEVEHGWSLLRVTVTMFDPKAVSK